MPAGVSVAESPAADAHKHGDPAYTAPGEVANAGGAGNLCHVECSNRGVCDRLRGTCACFASFGGAACDRHV